MATTRSPRISIALRFVKYCDFVASEATLWICGESVFVFAWQVCAESSAMFISIFMSHWNPFEGNILYIVTPCQLILAGCALELNVFVHFAVLVCCSEPEQAEVLSLFVCLFDYFNLILI